MVLSSDAGAAQPTLQTVERALSFLECIATSSTPMTIREIAVSLGLNITTCYHLFNTLSARNYVERNPDMTVRVGFQAAFLYEGYKRGFSTHQAMTRLVDGLSQATSETSYLSMLVNDSVVLSALAEGPQAVRAGGLYVGLSGVEHVRASGKVVLAFAGADARESLLDKALSSTPPAQRPAIRERVAKDIDATLERGWALDDQEYEIGICGIAGPIFSESGRVLGAIGIWAPATRFHDRQDSLIQSVLAAAAEASVTIGAAH